ncbi:MAG: peptidylprolyl isomerase [Nitrospirae bacterium]|nr:peptidylprolyl isomerase [Nitrospirota bacterium]
MTIAKKGDKVSVHYTGRLDDGTVFDSSEGREPLAFTVGGGQMIAGFDKAVDGLGLNESKTVKIPASEAYGERQDDMVIKVGKDQFPPDMDLEIGIQLQVPQTNGRPVIVTVTEIAADSVTLDANHSLAGKDLTFDIRLVSIG